jgi:hypothetical protein
MEVIIGLLFLLVIPFFLIFVAIKYSKAKKEIKSLSKRLQSGHDQFASYKADCVRTRAELEPLKKYSVVQDADNEAQKILKSARIIKESAEADYEERLQEAKELAKSELSDSREKGKALREKAERTLKEAHDLAAKIEETAKNQAKEIAGDAWEAKENATQYEASVKAMKNIIKGYGDEYLVPSHSLLDDLAAEYDHKEAGQELIQIRTLIKSMIKNDEATDCDYVESYRKSTAKEFVLDAYNGKIDTIMSKVKHDNYGKLKQQVEDSFRLVNHNGKAFRDARILSRYHEIILNQLKQAVIVHELKLVDREEQRKIKEEMREEARAIREYEKARKQAEKEEKMLQKAMAEARKQLESASNEQKLEFEQKLLELQGKLTEAEEKNQRALSMAQQTRRGHVYVISNIGSFGENIFKIGMTRRLEPLDRVKELGDASVPFSFDVHAMIHSEDAPTLEKALHVKFSNSQVNKVNPRKEFFNLNISDIKQEIEELGMDVHWTMQAEAMEYRESLAIIEA